MAILYLNQNHSELNSIKTKVHTTLLFLIYKYSMKYILIFLISLVYLTAVAQPVTTKKEVQCDKTDVMISVLKGRDYEEVPIWFGKGESKAPNYSLFVNAETKSWTIIQFNNELSCVLGSGESYTILSRKPYT
jgi:hypothetical protein